MHCCWLESGEPCGEPGEQHANLPLCPEHIGALRARMRQPLEGLARHAVRYHDLSDYPGFCYFALLPDGNVKIGFSHTEKLLKERMKAIGRLYGALPIILKVIPGGFVAEALMHHRFDHLRLPGNGERFERRGELLEFLAGAEDVAA